MACGGDLGRGGLTERIETPLQVCELLLVISRAMDLLRRHGDGLGGGGPGRGDEPETLHPRRLAFGWFGYHPSPPHTPKRFALRHLPTATHLPTDLPTYLPTYLPLPMIFVFFTPVYVTHTSPSLTASPPIRHAHHFSRFQKKLKNPRPPSGYCRDLTGVCLSGSDYACALVIGVKKLHNPLQKLREQ